MRKLYTAIFCLAAGYAASAQPTICSGNPLTGIDGDSYDSVASTGTNMHGSVASSKDGKLFSTNGGNLRYISTSDFSVMDSMNINVNYFVGSQSNDTMFGFYSNGTLARFNTATKTLIDTVALSGQYHIRVAERPNSKEVWISGFPMHVVDYTNAMVSTNTFSLGSTNINSVKISTDGLTVYAASGVTKRIYIIDAVNKVVTDSVDFAEGPAAFELKADNSKMYVAATGKVYVVETTNYTIVDSANVTKGTTGIYRHPTRPEMWCVHHVAEAVTIFDADTYALIDSFGTGGSPFFLAFGQTGVGVAEVVKEENVLSVYPNPAHTTLSVELTTDNATFELYDIKGALLATENVKGGKVILPIAELPSGVYYIKATDALGKVQVAKFNKI